MRNAKLIALTIYALAVSALPAPQDVEALVRRGDVVVLEARFGAAPTLEQLRALALAHANRARGLADGDARQREFAAAEQRFAAWIDAVQKQSDKERAQVAVELAEARLAYATIVATQWAAADLDQLDLTGGRRFDRQRLAGLLHKARQQCDQAHELLRPLREELERGGTRAEDQFLTLGVYDALARLRREAAYRLGWVSLYQAIVADGDAGQRAAALGAAERSFRELLDTALAGEAAARSAQGLGMALRELGRFDEAARQFERALQASGSAALAAQVRYEWARSDLAAGKFEDARLRLRPLLERPPDAKADEPVAVFYANLARLLEANSFLVEAGALHRVVRGGGDDVLAQRAAKLHETGLVKFNELAIRDGAWPALVQLYVDDVIDPHAAAGALTPLELLFTARRLAAEAQYDEALRRLSAAGSRPSVAPELAAEILFQTGLCHDQRGAKREAAAAFERIAREHRRSVRAPVAAGYACQLLAAVAEESVQTADYQRLIELLTFTHQTWPQHERRAELQWWLPVALQAVGRYSEAAEQFRRVPQESAHADEGRYRAVLCERMALEVDRSRLTSDELRARAERCIAALQNYAQAATSRAEAAGDARTGQWAAAALVHAAELCLSPGVERYADALALLDEVDRRGADDASAARALAARITAYRGLGRFDEAARVVEGYLTARPTGAGSPPSEQAVDVLATLADSMRREVEQLEADGQTQEARRLAAAAVPVFERLHTQLAGTAAGRSDAARLRAVRLGLARMQRLTGQYEAARALLAELLKDDPRDGVARRLYAQTLTASLPEGPSREQVVAAKEAWAAILGDMTLRESAPDRYWEARYHFLSLLLREGQAAQVEAAIRQEGVWYPELGGPAWHERLEGLRRQAAAAAGSPPPSTTKAAGGP